MISKLVKLLTIICFFVSTANAAEHEWKMATSWSGGPIMELGANNVAKKIEFLTDGRVKIKVFPAGVLGKALKVSEVVKNGIADMGSTWAGYDWGRDKTAVLFGGFAGSLNSEQMLHWLYEGGGVELWEQWRKEKFKVIGMPGYVRTREVFLVSRKPVRSLEDLKGLKIRTTGAWLEMSKELGAAPITAAGGDIYPMLERGVIDATEWGTLYENKKPGFHRIAKYIVLPGLHQPTAPLEIQINPRSWKKLSARDKQLVKLAIKQTVFEGWLTLGHGDAEAYKFYEEQGNEIIQLSPEVLERVEGLARNWADKQAAGNSWFKKVLDSQRSYEELWKNAPRYRPR